MSQLLAISIGPVQEFIAAARRTRDLWFGSQLLSEISKATARAVAEKGGKLIFPHPESNLEPESPDNVANVILAEIPDNNASDISAYAEQAANQSWKTYAEEARNAASAIIRNEQAWHDQIEDVVEFYAAWVATPDGGTPDHRNQVMRLLAGRKNFRNFLPATGDGAGIPKSSLDGQRESILQRDRKWPAHFRQKFRIRQGEQLDAIGLVKRSAGGNKPFPSVSRVAADPWVRGNAGRTQFEELKKTCQQLGGLVHRISPETFPQFKAFPYEGTVIYPNRHHDLWDETDESPDDQLKQQLSQITNALPAAEPYLAVLVADGDRMGNAISQCKTTDDMRKLSRDLATFAGEARNIIAHHNGILIYAGGDDVLAFVPVDQALDCARKLHNDFGQRLGNYATADGKSPTLSVGLGIGHFMENLEILLGYGRAAEKHAKNPRPGDHPPTPRNSLAIHLHKRGGTPIAIRMPWETHPDERLKNLTQFLNQGDIPAGLPYELQSMARLYQSWPKQTAATAIEQDVMRLLGRKKSHSGTDVKQQLKQYVSGLDAQQLLDFSQQLLVARLLAAVSRQAQPHSTPQLQETNS